MENSDLDAPQTPVIDRSTTGKRILFTLVFAVIGRLIEGVLAFVAVYQLLYTLITKRPPKAIVTRFANRLLGYAMEIGRYVPWNSPEKTFPSTIFRLSPMTSTQRQRHNHACQPAVPVRRGIVSQDRPFSDHQPVTVFVPYSRYVFLGDSSSSSATPGVGHSASTRYIALMASNTSTAGGRPLQAKAGPGEHQ